MKATWGRFVVAVIAMSGLSMTAVSCTTARGGGGSDDGTTATDATTVADAADATDAADASDAALAGDALDATDGTDSADATDGTVSGDATDGGAVADDTTDGAVSDDATDGTDASDGTVSGDTTDGTVAGDADATDGTVAGDADATDGTADTDATDGTVADDATDSSDGTEGFDGTVAGDATDGTDEADATDGTDATDGACVPVCEAGWQCGPNGCEGTCGKGCTADQQCNAAHLCEAIPVPVGVYGATCDADAGCNAESETWPACLNAKCDTGLCQLGTLANACAKNCALKKDALDHQGAENPDGIEDPDAVGSDCKGAPAGSLFGTNWTCVQVGDGAAGTPQRVCQPGTTFAPCTADADCPTGEACQLYTVNGDTSFRCAGARKGSVPSGAYCDADPALGPVPHCTSDICFGIGCTSACFTNQDCPVFQECSQDFPLFGADVALTFDICFSKQCDSNKDCAGASYCRLFGNGGVGDAFDIDPACAAELPNSSSLGGPCDGDLTDAIPGPECKGLCLTGGTCSSLCTKEADCAGGAVPLFCNVTEDPIDLDGVPGDDSLFVYGLCIPFDGSKSQCQTTSDCLNNEVCEFFQAFAPDGSIEGVGYCLTVAATGAAIGEVCGGVNAIQCKTGFCLPVTDTTSICSALCESTSDCAQGLLKTDLDPVGINQFCHALVLGLGGTLVQDNDTVYVPLCDPTPGTDSLEDCGDTFTCTEPGEACVGQLIAFGSSGPAKLEYQCFADVGGTAKLGEVCSFAAEATPAQLCEDVYCLEDSPGALSGTCSKLCKTTPECGAGYTCETTPYLQRKDGSSVGISLCRKAN